MKMPSPPIREIASQKDGLFSLPWVTYFSQLMSYLSSLPKSNEALPNYVNDAAAAAGGVPLYGFYRNGSIVMQRVV